VIDQKTGFLLPPEVEPFAKRMDAIVTTNIKTKMGEAGRLHVKSNFSLDAFTESLEGHIKDVMVLDNEDAARTFKLMFHWPLFCVVGLVVGSLVGQLGLF
jgi:hypothetical protein